jgi:pilus assembly protein CpaC
MAQASAGGGGGGGGGSGGSGGSGMTIALGGGSSEPPTSKVVNMLAIEGEDQVHLKVTVAEVQRSIIKQLGVGVSGELNFGGIASISASTSSPFGINALGPLTNRLTGSAGGSGNTLALTLRALEQTGAVKTLAEPTLTAISGEMASFLAGGEFPVPTGRDSDGTITLTFKPFGVALGFTPVVLSEGRISLRIKTEVSELSPEGSFSVGDFNVPALKVRRAETTMELPSGGSMVLGGLLQDSLRQSIGAFPGLGTLPILGPLFRSRDYLRNETELVIIVTPYLVKPVSRTLLATPDQGFAPASDAQAILLGNINRVYGAGGHAPDASYQYRGKIGFIYE